VVATFNAAGLTPGEYTATIDVNSDDPDESVVTIDVILTVVPVPVPDIVVTAPPLEMTLLPDESGTLAFTIGNIGTADLDWSVADGAGWLSELPVSGIITPEGSTAVVITFDATGLAPGEYQTTIVITSNDPDESPLTLDVTLTVNVITYQIYLPILNR
jgi:uncharacterized membrane protein